MIGGIPQIGSINPMPGAGMPGGGIGGIGGGLAKEIGAGARDAGGQESTFGEMLHNMVLERPTATHNNAENLATSLAAGGDVDPAMLATETAKAGIEIQMSTRVITQAVTGLRTLMQMQI